ncbi:P-type ATPase, partial [Staphylococcus epidermidis]
MDNPQPQQLKISHIITHHILQLKPPETIPTHPIILQPQTSIHESLLTPQSKKLQKNQNHNLIPPSINPSPTIQLNLTPLPQHPYLSQVIPLVNQPQNHKSTAEFLSHKLPPYLFYF